MSSEANALFIQAARYLGAGMASRLLQRRPLFLTLFVTARCGLRCGHCFYAREEADQGAASELTLEEYARFARQAPPFPKLVLTGGEPFLRRDLSHIAALFHDGRARTRQITIPTAGVHTQRIVDLVQRLLPDRPGLLLEIQLSIDGVGEHHDAVRGPGQFARLLETHAALSSLRGRFPGLRPRFNFTFSRVTQDWFPETFDFVTGTLGHPDLDLVLVRHSTRDPHFWGQVDLTKYRQAARLLHRLGREQAGASPLRILLAERARLERAIIARHHAGERVMSGCQAGTLFAVVDEAGEVRPCELLDTSFGNLRDHGFDFQRIWRGPRARAHRAWLRCSGCHCTFETCVRTTLSFQPRSYLQMVRAGLIGAVSSRSSGVRR